MDGTILNKKYDLVERIEALEEGGSYTLPVASANTLGGVKVGEGLSIDAESGVMSAPAPAPYVLPVASAETLGGVKIGEGLSIDAETGVMSAEGGLPDYSTTEQKTGQKWIDGKDIYFKTFDNLNINPAGVWAVIAQNTYNAERIIDAKAYSSDNKCVSNCGIEYDIESGNFRCTYSINSTRTLKEVVLYYTKTT